MDIMSLSTTASGLIHQVESNPLLITLTSGGIVLWLFTNIKNIWRMVTGFIIDIISFSITNTCEDNRGSGYKISERQIIFSGMLTRSKTLWERTVNLDLNDNQYRDRWSHYTGKFEMKFGNPEINTYGHSIKIFLGKLCSVYRSYKLDGQKITINTSVRVFFGFKKKFMSRLERELDMISEEIHKDDDIKNYVEVINGETFCGIKNKRSLESIFTNNNEHLELYNDIRRFIDNKEIYSKLNYPYKYAAMLYGVPGAGKTSTILAIASALNRDVCYVNLATETITKFLEKLNCNTNNRIYVFEDIDAIMNTSLTTRENTCDNGKNDNGKMNLITAANSDGSMKLRTISLSDLLNITDGLLSTDGAICLFTTNHIELMDPALLRAGRMNKVIEFKYLNRNTANRMLKTYLGVEYDNLLNEIKPAEFQEDILNVVLGKNDISCIEKKYCFHN